MKPIYQTNLSSINGNCYQACIASVLELELEDIPHFVELYGKDYFFAVQDWLAKFNLMMLRTTYEEMENGEMVRSFCPLPEGTVCIAFGKSQMHGAGVSHAVVGHIVGGLTFELLHDPNANTKGLDGNPVGLDFIVSKSPLSFVNKEIFKLNI